MTALAALLILLAPQSEARLRAGQEKLKVRDFDGAIPDFEKCLELNPGQYDAHFGLGSCFWEKDEYRKARDHFAKVVELVEKSSPGAPLPAVHQKLLGCALLLEEFDAAISEATRLIAIQSTGEYLYARALARQRSGDATGALGDCDAAIKEDALLTKARALKAELLLAGGDGKAALDELARAVSLKPNDPSVFLARACAHYREGRWREALGDLQSVTRLNTGQNSKLETQAYARAMESFLRTRLNTPSPPLDAVSGFEKVLKDLDRSASKNHLLSLPLYLADRISEDLFLKEAEAAPGRKVQARAEALFFVGERKLLAQDKDGARESFRKCVETGARGLFEHDLAQQRLKDLQNR